MNNKLLFLIVILLLSLSQNGLADDDEPRWYQIELIAFSNNNLTEKITETWPVSPGRPSGKQFIDLVSTIPEQVIEATQEQQEDALNESTPKVQEPIMEADNVSTATQSDQKFKPAVPFAVLEDEDYRLNLSAEKIDKSAEYDLLLHIGWRQPVFLPGDKKAINLNEELNQLLAKLARQQQMISRASQQDAAETPSIPDAAEELPAMPDFERYPFDNSFETELPIGPQPQQFFGAFRLSLSRFLHIDMDLSYRAAIDFTDVDLAAATQTTSLEETIIPEEATSLEVSGNINTLASNTPEIVLDDSGPRLMEFRLHESRRIKPDEIHYFDHPAMGVIVMVSRFEPPKPEEDQPLMQPFIP